MVHAAVMSLLASGVMALGADAPEPSSLEPWWRLLGRLHPLLVHFPIGLVLATAAVESWRWCRRDRGVSEFTSVAMAIAAVTAVGAVATGWLNAWQEGQDPSSTIALHSWLGTGIAAVLVVAAWMVWPRDEPPHRTVKRTIRSRAITLASAVGVGLVGHFGGELVHGDGYVEKALWRALGGGDSVSAEQGGAESVPSAGASTQALLATAPGTVDFRSQILPIFETHCYECHGRGKHKGGLAMDSVESLLKVDDDGVALKPREPEESLLWTRTGLPADDPDAMPPEGERLDEAKRALIRTWIEEGAAMESARLASPGAVGSVRVTAATVARAQAALPALRARGVQVQQVAQDDVRLEVIASLASPPFGDADLVLLEPAAGAIARLDLARTAVTDAGLATLPEFPVLETLRLDATGITDAGLACLRRMPALVTLNVHSTGVTDAGLAAVAPCAALERVYLWNTRVTKAGADALSASRPGVRVDIGQP